MLSFVTIKFSLLIPCCTIHERNSFFKYFVCSSLRYMVFLKENLLKILSCFYAKSAKMEGKKLILWSYLAFNGLKKNACTSHVH